MDTSFRPAPLRWVGVILPGRPLEIQTNLLEKTLRKYKIFSKIPTYLSRSLTGGMKYWALFPLGYLAIFPFVLICVFPLSPLHLDAILSFQVQIRLHRQCCREKHRLLWEKINVVQLNTSLFLNCSIPYCCLHFTAFHKVHSLGCKNTSFSILFTLCWLLIYYSMLFQSPVIQTPTYLLGMAFLVICTWQKSENIKFLYVREGVCNQRIKL